MQNSFMQGLTNGFMQGISASMQPHEKTPQEVEAEHQAELRAEQERQAAELARAEKRRQRNEELDRQAFLQLSLLGAPFNPEKKISTDFQSPIACSGKSEEFVCHVTVCGGSTANDICCPAGYPKLNECDCKCYPSDAEFECMQYAGCNYSTPAGPR